MSGFDVGLLDGWVPLRVYWRGDAPVVDWCYLGRERFTDPFFDQTVAHCMSRPFNLLFRHQTPVEVLSELRERSPGVTPAGFIFHASRCGSTLVTQMLAALPENVVISEAGPIDKVLRASGLSPQVTDEERAEWLRGLVCAFGQRRRGDERRLFVKFDSWHALFLPLVERAFPGVPWLFLYREPVEVLVSHARRRGAHMIPGVLDPALVGFGAAEVSAMRLEEYSARVLAAVCRAALRHRQASGRGSLVNYRQLPDSVWTTLAEFFGLELSEADTERMRRAARLDAKNPALDFDDDTAAKNLEAGDGLRREAERWARPVYEQLEEARRAADTDEN